MTKTAAPSIKDALNKGLVAELADCFRLMGLGNMLTPLKRTFTALTGAATYNLTALDASGETAGVSNANRLAAASIFALRVTAATTGNTVGSYITTDASGTTVSPTAGANVGIAKISDDGTTLTFPTADVTAFIIEYFPRSLVDNTTVPSGSGIGFAP